MSDIHTAEQLWARAHEQVKKGDFATAVRDLATCFQILQALGDPRVYEVHKRWTEVHQMYLEDGARQAQPAAPVAATLEAQAEAAANSGDLDAAVALYTRAAAQSPGNELVRERIAELQQARHRADDLARGTVGPSVAVHTDVAALQTVDVGDVVESVDVIVGAAEVEAVAAVEVVEPAAASPGATSPVSSDDDWSDIQVEEPVRPAAVAPTMAIDDAPVGMQSLDVPFSVGEAIDSFQADDLPVEGQASGLPVSVASAPAESIVEVISVAAAAPSLTSDASLSVESARVADVAFLEELLARVHANRRAS